MSASISIKVIANRIFLIRKQKVMIDRDLAQLYEVPTKRLNEQVKRNIKRFPKDFMFQLSEEETAELVANCDHLKDLKYSYQQPYAFTEQGVAMLSSVLNSPRAIAVNIVIMRTFVKLRKVLLTHKELSLKLQELEMKVGKHDEDIKVVLEAIRRLMTEEE